MAQAIVERLPLWRKECKGIKGGVSQIIFGIEQQGDRRRHLSVTRQRHHALGFRRPFDQDEIGLNFRQRLHDAIGGTGTMMTNT